MPRTAVPRRSRPRRNRAGNLLADLVSLGLIALVMLGITGFVYQALRPGGWVGTAVDYLWEKGAGALWATAFGAVIVLAVVKAVLFPKDSTDSGDLLFYVGAALGLFYSFRLIVTGSL